MGGDGRITHEDLASRLDKIEGTLERLDEIMRQNAVIDEEQSCAISQLKDNRYHPAVKEILAISVPILLTFVGVSINLIGEITRSRVEISNLIQTVEKDRAINSSQEARIQKLENMVERNGNGSKAGK